MARVHLFALFFFVAIGLSCGTKSDEEILRERIDSTPVHLYLATKIAIDGYLGAASGVLGKAKDLVPSAKGCLGSG